MESLHSDIIYKILSDHLPVSSVLNGKLVCKTWKTLLSRYKVGLLCMVSIRGETDAQQTCYGDYDETDAQPTDAQLYYRDYDEVNNDHGQFFNETLTKINLPPIKMVGEPPKIIGSCNGLVCISIPEDDDHNLHDPVYICNPTNGEYVNLPKLSLKDGQITSGFGYLPKTNEYKVVRIHYDEANPCGKVQVYTLGSGGGWRNIKDTPFQFNNIPGVVGNGVIYFMEDLNLKWKVVTFDLADEEFRVLEQPPCFGSANGSSFYDIKVLGGYLYVVRREPGKSVDMWSFKNNPIEAGNNKNGTDHCMSWREEFSIPCQDGDANDNYFRQPFSLTKSNQVLFWLRSSVLCCYDPEDGTVSEIASVDQEIISSLQAIPHMNSNISLKGLGIQSIQA